MPIARVLVGFVTLLAVAAPSASAEGLNAFRVKATAKNVRALAEAGFDVTEGRDPKRGTIEVVAHRSRWTS